MSLDITSRASLSIFFLNSVSSYMYFLAISQSTFFKMYRASKMIHIDRDEILGHFDNSLNTSYMYYLNQNTNNGKMENLEWR